MKFLIIEDEPYAARQLQQTILACRPQAAIVDVLSTVEEAAAFLRTKPDIDLIFLDIHLADGQSFSIFDKVDVQTPVIFTTAYDQYAIKAFEVNSIDYLLKPVSGELLAKAILKFEKLWMEKSLPTAFTDIARLRKILLLPEVYKENFLIPFKDQLIPVAVKDFAWFEVQNGRVSGKKFTNGSLVLEERSIDELMGQLDPKLFYRANRQYLINRLAVKTVSLHFHGKLTVTLDPAPKGPVIISRERASQFKDWMGS